MNTPQEIDSGTHTSSPTSGLSTLQNIRAQLSGVNRFLFILFISLLIFIIGQLVYSFTIQRQSQTKIQPSVAPDPGKVNDIFNEVSQENTLNKLNYEQVKAQVPDGTIQESRFTGVVLDVSRSSEGLQIELESTLPNSLGKKVWYRYEASSVSKISFMDSQGNPLTLGSFSEGDGVHIDETNDYAKPYPESIVSIKITKI